MTTAADVAAWMFEQIKSSRAKFEYQSDLVEGIVRTFGPEWS